MITSYLVVGLIISLVFSFPLYLIYRIVRLLERSEKNMPGKSEVEKSELVLSRSGYIEVLSSLADIRTVCLKGLQDGQERDALEKALDQVAVVNQTINKHVLV